MLPHPTVQQLIQQALGAQQAGDLARAESLYHEVLRLHPSQPDALHLLGLIAHHRGRSDDAIQLIRRAITGAPRIAPFHNNLANILRSLGRFEDAVAAYQTALALQPNFPEARHNLASACNDLGTALAQQNRLDEARTAYEQAVSLNPNLADGWSNLGDVLATLRYVDDAIRACQRAIHLKPEHAAAHNNLGNALRLAGRTGQAIEHFQRAATLDPYLAAVQSNLANALSDQGRVIEAEAAYRRALALQPHPNVHSNLLYHLLYCDHPPQLIYDEHRNFDLLHAQPLAPAHPTFPNSRDPSRRLRIGYVSADFRRHSVNYFVEPFLSHHDRENFEIFCYADHRWADETTDRLRTYSTTWRDITSIDDKPLAALIRADGIDILIDLAGHTVGNRLLVFARKPAPVQVTYLGYPATTGLSAIDYRITDATADPPQATEQYHSERLVRLPNSFLCYQLSDGLPSVSPLPALTTDAITFGCFNNFAKLSPATIALWSRILREVPHSKLFLKFRSLADPETRNLVHNLFAKHHISPDRIDLLGHTDTYAQHLEIYSRIDIALDPFPYNGTTTTCEALAMGLPVITLAGQTHVSRVGVSIVTSVDLGHLIAQSPDHYVQIAHELATSPENLAQLRSTLRDRMRRSPLTDAPAFTRNLQDAYREMWRTYCQLRA